MLAVIITILVVMACYFLLRFDGSYMLVNHIKDGTKEDIYRQELPKSVNRPEGIQFSYTGWLRIDDFGYRYGEPKIIFTKGSDDLSVACPALIIDANTNTLLVKIDTFGAQETISVVSVPIKKWLHIAIVVKQDSVDVYINGILYAHHILTQLPKQNTASVLNSPGGGFAGRIVRLEYYPEALSNSEILSQAGKHPPTGDEKDQVFPQYFDMSWFNP
jgi:hypothetical protein